MQGEIKGGCMYVTYRGTVVLVLNAAAIAAAKDHDMATEVPIMVAPVIKRDIYPLYWTKAKGKLWFLDNDVFWLALDLSDLLH